MSPSKSVGVLRHGDPTRFNHGHTDHRRGRKDHFDHCDLPLVARRGDRAHGDRRCCGMRNTAVRRAVSKSKGSCFVPRPTYGQSMYVDERFICGQLQWGDADAPLQLAIFE